MPNRSTPDYLFEKAEGYFGRSRTDSNGRAELEAVDGAFMVKAVELDVRLQKSCQSQLPRLFSRTGVTTMDKLQFDRTDYSVVVKNRAPPPGSWKWQTYRAERSSPVKQSYGLLSHYGDCQSGRKRGAQAAIGRQSGVNSYSASASEAKCAIEQLRD